MGVSALPAGLNDTNTEGTERASDFIQTRSQEQSPLHWTHYANTGKVLLGILGEYIFRELSSSAAQEVKDTDFGPTYGSSLISAK